MRIPKWKRTLDLTILTVSAPVWVPVMLLLALWTQLVSRGPVFFRQERVGYLGRTFIMWKFRSMHDGADERCHQEHWDRLMLGDLPMIKLDGKDSRLIPGARWIRASGLDELPQLFNVLRGDMSLVGPRPCTLREFEKCDSVARRRTEVLPGITGWWQISGKEKLRFREMIALDISYQKIMSPMVDLRILASTIPTVITQWKEARAQQGARGFKAAPVAKLQRTILVRGK